MAQSPSGNPKQYSSDLADCGIQGYRAGDYCVFLSEKAVPPLKVMLAKGMTVDVANDIIDRMRGTSDAGAKQDVILDDGLFRFEVDREGASEIKKLGDQGIANSYKELVSCMRRSSDNYGYDMRTMLSRAASIMTDVNPRDPKRTFGGTTLVNLKDRIKGSYAFQEGLNPEKQKKLIDALDGFLAKVAEQPKVKLHMIQAQNYHSSPKLAQT